MAKVIKVIYGEEASVRIEDYRYVKPRIELTAEVHEGESFNDVLELLQYTVQEKLEIKCKQIYNYYKEKLKTGELK